MNKMGSSLSKGTNVLFIIVVLHLLSMIIFSVIRKPGLFYDVIGQKAQRTPYRALKCLNCLHYPFYRIPKHLTISPLLLNVKITNRIVIPCFRHSTWPEPLEPVLEKGIVFYVYAPNMCQNGIRYMSQVLSNSRAIRQMTPNASIALVTNCDIPFDIANYLDVIVPIHNSDVLNKGSKEWTTRVLYNAYLPFNYSFIIDTHVFPCDEKAYDDILDGFKMSNNDIQFSSRVNTYIYASGCGVLSKFGKPSFRYWQRCYKYQMILRYVDDQIPMTSIMKHYSKEFKFAWLSSNYFFASHGITPNGDFVGSSQCYRSSIVVTGRVRWIHGSPTECTMMNGKNSENIMRNRVYFSNGTCETHRKGFSVIFSEEELAQAVSPQKPPVLNWADTTYHPRNGVEWRWNVPLYRSL